MSARRLRRRAPVLSRRWRGLGRHFGLVRLDDRALPAGNEILGFMVTRDNLAMVRHSLAWHRRLGVDRFFVVDNGSVDGTTEFLLAQPDVHVFETRLAFAKGGFGSAWHEALLDRYGEDRWCVIVDDDEWLVWPGMEDVALDEFIAFHEAAGTAVLEGLMIDMYARGSIAEAETESAASLLETFPWYDPGPYHRRPRRNTKAFPEVLVSGGARARVFTGDPRWPVLTKVPLVKWRRGMRRRSCHTINAGWPTAETAVGLLHFRHTADFARRSAQYLAWQAGSAQVPAYLQGMERAPDLSLWHEGAARFRDTAQFVEHGLLHVAEDYARFWREASNDG